jgi:hypothetical protein
VKIQVVYLVSLKLRVWTALKPSPSPFIPKEVIILFEAWAHQMNYRR